jgi:hypothetical protein
MVVLRWQFSSHEVTNVIRKACNDAGTPFLYATSSGVRGLEEAISRQAIKA